MKTSHSTSLPLYELPLWESMRRKKAVFTFDLELTARCNNNCRHCYINLPADDGAAMERELTLSEIDRIAGQAVSSGALWCLITGGEPLLRIDFLDVYLILKKKGLLVSVFTNAAQVTPEHVEVFKKYPPQHIEVTVYGITPPTYERVTRKPGSYASFMNGLGLLLDGGIKVRLKAMAIRSNVHEMPAIAEFCRKRSKGRYRYDPMLHLRYDRDESRNREIEAERLSPAEIVALERADPERFEALKEGCDILIRPEFEGFRCHHLFHCSTGKSSFTVSPDGHYRPCASLWHPQCVYDLRKGSLSDAIKNVVPNVRKMKSERKEFLENCHVCPFINLCLWCPAHAYLECGELDRPVGFFCEVAHARASGVERGGR